MTLNLEMLETSLLNEIGKVFINEPVSCYLDSKGGECVKYIVASESNDALGGAFI